MNRNSIKRCRKLRKCQTDAEGKLWFILRNRKLSGIKFRRQFPIGEYILDFYSPVFKMGIEADGGQHYDEIEEKRDEIRKKRLSELGVEVIRFSNFDILNNIEGVYQVIEEVIGKRKAPSPWSSPRRGEERNRRGEERNSRKEESPLTLVLSPKGRGEK